MDDNTTLKKRPLYKIFQQIWTPAPADGKTNVRYISSDDNEAFQGATDAATPKAFRQDLLAMVNGNKMTLREKNVF